MTPIDGEKLKHDSSPPAERQVSQNKSRTEKMQGVVTKYIKGERSGYFHHSPLITDTEKAYREEGKDIEDLNFEIPDWREKLAEATATFNGITALKHF
ncbi:MAG: hypothetical protein AAB488_01705 [Patescibacteria group bacterium]